MEIDEKSQQTVTDDIKILCQYNDLIRMEFYVKMGVSLLYLVSLLPLHNGMTQFSLTSRKCQDVFEWN